MATFETAHAKFTIALDTLVARQCKSELGFNPIADDAPDKLEADPILLVDVLYFLCRDQCKAKNITELQFAESLVGDAIGDAAKAYGQAWLDFFPQRKRSLLRSLAEKQAAVNEKAEALVRSRIDDPTLEANLLKAAETRLDRELQAALTRLNGATSSPATSESTPAA